MNLEIRQYTDDLSNLWDRFVKEAGNAHFMFCRQYMDYHKDRFEDCSIVVFNDDELLAVLPASRHENIVVSHAGLSFGGLITKRNVSLKITIEIFLLIKKFYSNKNFHYFLYKKLPEIYNPTPYNEDLYALYQLNAQLKRRDVSSTIDLTQPIKYSKGRKWSVKKAQKSGMTISKPETFDDFWHLLNAVLWKHHKISPVHSIDEITSLHQAFPGNIHCYTANLNGDLLAGTVIFETAQVAHTQYMANSEKGRETGALDFLIDHLIKNVFFEKNFFSFGISTTNEGKDLNEGLYAQKSSFGAFPMMHDQYEVKLDAPSMSLC